MDQINRRSLILGASSVATLGIGNLAVSNPSESSSQKERVQGIGGLFFRSQDPKALAAWYQEHLGVDHPPWQQLAGPTAFTPMPKATNYFGSPQQAWMVNFRVANLDAMVDQLRASNIEVKVDAEKTPYGRFARLHDPEGNPIELWEPAPK
jgi:glyoxylase I family protein